MQVLRRSTYPTFILGLILLLLCAGTGSPSQVLAADRIVAFQGAHLIPVVGPEISQGVLVIKGKEVLAAGPVKSVRIPAGAEVVDVSGKVIMPGLICTHSHIGGWGGGDRTGPIQPETRILDALNARDAGFRRAQAGGITTKNIMPGSGHLISGQTVYVKLRPAQTIDDMLIYDEDGRMMGGLKMANGTNSMRDAPFPGTRAKSASLVRQRFIQAQEYRDKVERAAGNPDKLPDRDLALEVLVEVLEGKRVVHHHTHRHDDIMTVLRLKEEFGFRLVLHHISEGWLVAEEIAAAGVPCSIIILDSPGGKYEAVHLTYRTGAVLEQAGVSVAYHTDDWITDSRWFFRCPAFGMRAGLSRQAALESITLAGAKMLDLDRQIGSLEVGKDADFIILSGDPFSVYTHVLETWVEGQKVFDRSDPEDRLYAVGGPGAGNDQRPYLCCYDHALMEN